MGYLVFDTETSGLFDWSRPADAEGQPRLASFAFLWVDDDLEIEQRYCGLIKPDGWQMAAASAAINGLSQERLDAEGIPAWYTLGVFRTAIDEGRTLVAHNLQFDTKVMRGELRRAAMSDAGCLNGICTMRGLTPACNLPKPYGAGLKYPKLTEACRILLGYEMKGAHTALADAKIALALLRVMRDRGLLTKEAA